MSKTQQGHNMTPAQSRIKDKLAHLTPQQRAKVLKMAAQLAPAHNAKTIKDKKPR